MKMKIVETTWVCQI